MSSSERVTDIHELQVSVLETAIAYADTVTVEFGTGSCPLFEASTTIFDATNLYIGVNIDSKQHQRLAEKVGGVNGFAVFSELSDNKINQLPIPDNSVHAAFMGNLFGEPNSPHIMHSFKDRNGKYRGNSDIQSKRQTLLEAQRILRPGATLVILENMTPYGTGYGYAHSSTAPYGQMVEDLLGAGYDIECALSPRDIAWQE
ncbi:hypothetical protein EYC59_03170 [Candidatus Saccharibacteria bacterium]|nr:MAG: hypothetical protein EYC59_03170 [Candidatus Saccharibacteria bacterium]